MTVERSSLDALTERPHEVVFPGHEPKTVRLSLAAGESVAEHRHPERTVVLYLVEGRLDVRLDGESTPLDAGDLLRFDGRKSVSPKAEVDSEAVLVLAEGSSDED